MPIRRPHPYSSISIAFFPWTSVDVTTTKQQGFRGLLGPRIAEQGGSETVSVDVSVSSYFQYKLHLFILESLKSIIELLIVDIRGIYAFWIFLIYNLQQPSWLV